MGKNFTVSGLLDHLHRGATWRYLWTTEGRQSLWCKAGDPLPAIPAAWRNVYFGVHPTSKRKGSHERATIPDVTAVNCLFAEFDAKDFDGDKAAIVAHLDALWRDVAMPFPTVIVDSGGGYHCYWLLEHTVTVDNGNRGDLAALQRGWVAFVGGDHAASDLARVLRLPGTVNRKYEPPRRVTITESDDYRLYTLETLIQAMGEPVIAETPTPVMVGGNEQRPPTDRARGAAIAQAALAGELETLRRTPEGGRNEALNKATYKIAGYADHLDAERTQQELIDAGLQIGLGSGETLRAVSSGWEAGKAKPRLIPEPTIHLNGNGRLAADLPPTTGDDDGRDRRRLPNPGKYAVRGGWSFPFYWEGYRAEDGGLCDAWRDLAEAEDWQFARGFDEWMHWTGAYWERLGKDGLGMPIQDLLDSLNRQAAEAYQAEKAMGKEADEDALAAAAAMRNATKRTAGRVSSVCELIRPWYMVKSEDLDSGGLLNLRNGTLDMHTLEFRSHDRGDLLTYCLPYDFNPDADCPRWRGFLAEVLIREDGAPDAELADLVQEAVGAALAGETRYESMFWLHGSGANGKSVLLKTLRALLGDLALDVNFHRLGQPGDYQLADLPGKRLLISSESAKGHGTAESYLKMLTSGEVITVRPIYGSPFQMTPCGVIFWAMNDRPIIRDSSDAIWRRLKLIPFHRTFAPHEQDRRLSDKLESERAGILNWALAGLKRLRLRGRMSEPAQVQAAVAEYRHDSSPVLQWFDAYVCLDLEKVNFTWATEVFNHYRRWCEANGRQCPNNVTFGLELTRVLTLKDATWARQRRNKGTVYHLTLQPLPDVGGHIHADPEPPTGDDAAAIFAL